MTHVQRCAWRIVFSKQTEERNDEILRYILQNARLKCPFFRTLTISHRVPVCWNFNIRNALEISQTSE